MIHEAKDTLLFLQNEKYQQYWGVSSLINNCYQIRFNCFGGTKGNLTAIEGKRNIPFDIKRIYYITAVPNDITRGFHSHRELEQVLLCVNGSVKIRIKTPYEEEVVLLNDPSEGLYIGHMVWREMFEFSPGAVLLVLASEFYTEDDYIRDYNQYLKEATVYFKEQEKRK